MTNIPVALFPTALQYLRDKYGLSQTELADGSYIDQKYISMMENGKMERPARLYLMRLAFGLHAGLLDDADTLLISAEYPPLVPNRWYPGRVENLKIILEDFREEQQKKKRWLH